MANARRQRRELAYGIAKLRGLQRTAESTLDDAKCRALATRISQQAEVCLHLLDEYQSSVPGRMWSDAERRCQPLREDLRRTGRDFRVASGEMELRTREELWGRSWWSSPELAFPDDGGGDSEEVSAGAKHRFNETPIAEIRHVEVVLGGLEFDPDPGLLPVDPEQMMTLVEIVVANPQDGASEIFGATLCTPEWLATRSEGASFLPATGLLIVRSEDFGRRRIRREIEGFLARIHEETWADAARRIREWFPEREFDGLIL